MKTNFDVVVVGGGIIGAACADELAGAGLRTVICEAGVIGGDATAAGMGHLAVMDDSEAQFQLTRYSQRLWNRLTPELPPSAEYIQCGALWIAAHDEEMTEVHRKYAFYTERGLKSEVLNRHELKEAEPNLREGLEGALLVPGDGVCYAPAVARYLIERAARKGTATFFHSRVTRIHSSGVELANGDSISSAAIVVATGTHVNLPEGERWIRPRKGHLAITDRYPGFVRHQLIELGYLKSAHATDTDSVAFNIQPRVTGQMLIGSSRQFGSGASGVDERIARDMLKRAVEYMPKLTSLSVIRLWTGFRAATPDKLPLIGPSGELSNVYLALGHEGLGISTSLATARLLADQLLKRESEIPRTPYLPLRKFVLYA